MPFKTVNNLKQTYLAERKKLVNINSWQPRDICDYSYLTRHFADFDRKKKKETPPSQIYTNPGHHSPLTFCVSSDCNDQ